MESKAPGLFNEAVKKLQEANEELCRPEEDVVSYLVCKNSQFAIVSFLKGYLLRKNIEPVGEENINALYKRCVEVNEKFGEIDLHDFTCKGYKPDSRSCSDTAKVSLCYEIAGKMDELLRREKVLQ
jgi:HEPN domain-containing protein